MVFVLVLVVCIAMPRALANVFLLLPWRFRLRLFRVRCSDVAVFLVCGLAPYVTPLEDG